MLNIVKTTGEIVPFDENKVLTSIKRAGIPENIQSEVLEAVKARLYEGIPTSEIYKVILSYLSVSPQPFSKSKYSLKSAIMELGPTGYPFEDYLAKILNFQGYKTQVRQILQGKCVKHEIDIIAEKDGKRTMVEAKFHNLPGTRTDVQVALYTKARFDDVKFKNNITDAWLVTNTKATSEAEAYCACENMKILSWSFPLNESLRDIIEKEKLFPITAIQSLSNAQIQALLQNHIVLSKDLNSQSFDSIIKGISNEEKEEILKEALFLSGS